MKKFLLDERAVSTALGAVLIMGILVSASTIYLSIHVPEWTKDYESLHIDDIEEDFAELKSLIGSIVLIATQQGENTTAAGSTPIKMAPDKVPIFGISPPGSNLQVLPDDESFVITPTVEGGPPPAAPGSDFWEENSFTDPHASYYHVDNSSNELKLAKQTFEYPDLILDDPTEAERLEGVQYFDRVIIENGGTLYVAIGFLKLCANNITVGPGGNIIANYKGYWGGTSEKDGEGTGGGKKGLSGNGGGGAGYGGDGGDGGNNSGSGGDAYGYETSNSSIQQGSGGGGGGSKTQGQQHFVGGSGGNGGGAIWLDAEEINIAGNISADGDEGIKGSQEKQAGGGGGGSGGGILIRGRNVTISGNLSAKGGDGGSGANSGGGGAGGRIKVFYDSSYTGPSSSTDPSVNVNGGSGNEIGGNGTFHDEQITYTSPLTYVDYGRYISDVYDTGNDSTCYGKMTWDAEDLNGQRIEMRVRTSMFEEMEGNATLWPNCPAVTNDGTDISDLSSASDGHRYIQYRADLYTEDTTTTPILRSVRMNYNYSAYPGGGSPILANSSGIIKFQSGYLYYPNQEIVYEHGAVIKCQGKGEGKMGFMLYPGNRSQLPGIKISGIPALQISMVDLTGSPYFYSGSTTISIEISYTDYKLVSDNLTFPNLTLNITTESPSIWGKRFNKTLAESGLDDSYYDVKFPTAKNVAVEFYGHGDGVQLYLEKTAVEVEI